MRLLVLAIVPVAAAQPPAPPDPFLDRARDAVVTFVQSLPNYAVRQETVRSMQAGGRPPWLVRDRISAELLYQNGSEKVHNLRLNGKPADVQTVQDSGAWSSGQFGDLLRAIFDPSTLTRFRKRRAGKLDDRAVWIYDYSVDRERSRWELAHDGKTFLAAYDGTVWIDQQTARTLRFVMRSRGLPVSFPLERAETSTEYTPVRIGSVSFVLPTRSMAEACTRGLPMGGRFRGPVAGGTRYCARNEIEFKGYRQFGVESSIAFE